MAGRNYYQDSSVELNNFDLELFSTLLTLPSDLVSDVTDGDVAGDDRPLGPDTDLDLSNGRDISWLGCIVWSKRLNSKFKSHAETYKYKFYTKLGYCKMIWKTINFPHPLMDWKTPFQLLEVDRKREAWQDDDGTYYVPVFETSVGENCHVPIADRSWDLIIPPQCVHVGRQMDRDVQTTVVVWGAEALRFENSGEETHYPRGIIRFDVTQPIRFVIFYHEKISSERILEMKCDFENSELACFDALCNSAVYQSTFDNEVAVQLISVTPNKRNELNKHRENVEKRIEKRQTLSHTLFGSDSDSNSIFDDLNLSDAAFLDISMPSQTQAKIIPTGIKVQTVETDTNNNGVLNGTLNEVHRVVLIPDNSTNVSSEESYCTADTPGGTGTQDQDLSGEIIPSTPPTVVVTSPLKSMRPDESCARRLFQDNSDMVDGNEQVFAVPNGHGRDKEMDYLLSEDIMCDNSISMEQEQDEGLPEEICMAEADTDSELDYRFTPYLTEL